jgi:hypothetical protein
VYPNSASNLKILLSFSIKGDIEQFYRNLAELVFNSERDFNKFFKKVMDLPD